MFTTLARSTDKSRFLVPIHAQVSLSSILSYRFRVALYGELNRAKCQQKQYTTYKKHLFATLTRSYVSDIGTIFV